MVSSTRSAGALAAAAVWALLTAGAAASNVTCSDGVYMVVARASTEPPGEGIIGSVAEAVQKQLSGSASVAVKYPATLGNYFTSEIDGVEGMMELVKQYADACPKGKMALLGYSQGAQVVGDTLCGNSEQGFKQVPPLATTYTKNIVAAIQMGDPSFVPGLPYDKGTSKTAGIFPRQNTSACLPYKNIIQSYCDNNDLYCASGSSLTVHYEYTVHYGTVAADFIISQFKASSGSSSGSTTGTASSTASTAASTNSSSKMTATSGATTAMSTTGTAGGAGASSSSSGLAGHAAPAAGLGWFAAGLLALL